VGGSDEEPLPVGTEVHPVHPAEIRREHTLSCANDRSSGGRVALESGTGSAPGLDNGEPGFGTQAIRAEAPIACGPTTTHPSADADSAKARRSQNVRSGTRRSECMRSVLHANWTRGTTVARSAIPPSLGRRGADRRGVNSGRSIRDH
jgi:hypothetical protein